MHAESEKKDIIEKDIDDCCCILNIKYYKKVLIIMLGVFHDIQILTNFLYHHNLDLILNEILNIYKEY